MRDELAALAGGDAPPLPDRGLVGRAPAMRALRAACDEALAGALRVVAPRGRGGDRQDALRGGAGRATRAAAAALVAWGACEEDEGAPAYWPWRQRPARARRRARCCPPRRRPTRTRRASRCGTGVAQRLAEQAARRPLVIVLEDVHWADPSSLGLLGHLVRAPAQRPAARAAHAPAAGRGAPGGARPARGVLHQPRARRARLELEVAQLAEAVGGRAVTGRGGASRCGSARAATRSMSPSSCARWRPAAPRSRAACARSSPAARRRCRRRPARRSSVAAVAGTEFSLPRRRAGRGAGASRAARRASSRRSATACSRRRAPAAASPTRSRARSLYEAQPSARRAECHARLAEVLAARLEREPDQPVAEVAHHAVMAARGGLDAAPALRWSREAAREARAVLAHAEAAGHLERALEALELGELGHGRRSGSRCCSEAAATSGEAGALGAAQERYAQAAVLARRLGDADAFAEAALGYAAFQHYGDVDEEALALLEEARRMLLGAGDERGARPGARAARRAARPDDRPAAARGAARRGDRDGPRARRPRRRWRGCSRSRRS